MSQKIKVSVVGATGYTGLELLMLLARHPEVEVVEVTSRQEQGRPVAEVFPSLRGFYDLTFSAYDRAQLKTSDVVFFATPHTVAMKEVAALLASGVRVIDLSADFRLKDIATWEKWYQVRHEAREYVSQAVYGLVELNRDLLPEAHLVAVPGCYPTVVALGLLPLLQGGYIDSEAEIIADCKSSVSGAGRGAKVANLYGEVADSFKAYGITGHRHLPEIEQTVTALDKRLAGKLIFVPHLVPMVRGMEATIYVKLRDPKVDACALYADFYRDEYFVDLLPEGVIPETRSVRGSNRCGLSVFKAYGDSRIIISAVIDNLVKGAAGQAVQSMNVMFGLDETLGLQMVPLTP